MELKDFKWQTTPRFLIEGSRDNLMDILETAKDKGYTIDSNIILSEGDKLMVHLTHISRYSTVSNGRLQILLASNLLKVYLDIHYKFVQDMLNDNFKTIEFPTTDGVYPVIITQECFMVEGFIYSIKDVQAWLKPFDLPIGKITNEEIVFLRDVKCFRIGCTDVSYNDCIKLIDAMY